MNDRRAAGCQREGVFEDWMEEMMMIHGLGDKWMMGVVNVTRVSGWG